MKKSYYKCSYKIYSAPRRLLTRVSSTFKRIRLRLILSTKDG